MRHYRAAIIGTGGIASAHVEALNHDPRVRLVAAVDIRQDAVQAFCETHNVPASYTSVSDMLKNETPDLVHICTPPHLHAELSIQCMEANAWVICEKPLAASLKEVDSILDAETRTGAFTSSVYQWRFGAGAPHLKQLIDSNQLGKRLLGICQTTWYRDDAYYAVPWRGNWDTELGGCSMGHGIHAMDLFLWLYGPWAEVDARIDHVNHTIEVEDVSLAIVKFENGAYGNIINSVVSPRQESYIRMDFQHATVELKHLYAYQNNHWTYSSYENNPEQSNLALWRQLPEDVPSLHAGQVRHVLDCLENNTRPLTSGEGARMTLEFVTSLYKSALTGSRVARGSIVAGDAFYERMNGGLSI